MTKLEVNKNLTETSELFGVTVIDDQENVTLFNQNLGEYYSYDSQYETFDKIGQNNKNYYDFNDDGNLAAWEKNIFNAGIDDNEEAFAFLRLFDQNADGKVSLQEWQAKVDTNGDGTKDKRVSDVIAGQDKKFTREELAYAFTANAFNAYTISSLDQANGVAFSSYSDYSAFTNTDNRTSINTAFAKDEKQWIFSFLDPKK